MLASQATREGAASLYREGARRRILEGGREKTRFLERRVHGGHLNGPFAMWPRFFKPFHIHILVNKKSKVKM